MSSPLPPSSYNPGAPYGAPKQGPSCWTIGGISCVVVVLLAIAGFGISTYMLLHSAKGRAFTSGFSGVMTATMKAQPEIQADLTKLGDIQAAIVRYHTRNSAYPDSLSQLVPGYLPDWATLRSTLDTSSDPKHVFFTYTKPTEGEPETSELVSFDWSFPMTFGAATVVTKTHFAESLGGTVTKTQTQTTTTGSSTTTTTTTLP